MIFHSTNFFTNGSRNLNLTLDRYIYVSSNKQLTLGQIYHPLKLLDFYEIMVDGGGLLFHQSIK